MSASPVKRSAALSRIGPSATIAMTQRARDLKAQGRDVISLSIGEPDFPTPQHVMDAAAAKVAEGETKYPPVPGLPELREAICEKFERDNGVAYTPQEVIVSAGGKQVISNALLATLDPGDEVVIPAPCWVSYTQLVTLAGATPVVVPTDAASRFVLSPEQLDAAITPRTRWLIINSPSNPTGAVYTSENLRALADVLVKHPQVMVLSDDIYEHLVYDGVDFVTMAAVAPQLRERTLTMNGVSKAYAMTGWRLGYGAGPPALIAAMSLMQSQLTGGAARVSQWAAHAALTGPQGMLAERREIFRSRRALVVDALNAIPGIDCATPSGAFYVFASCENFIGRRTPKGTVIATDEDFCMALLEEEGVATVQGQAFEASPFFRVSYAASEGELRPAVNRIANFCSTLR